MQWGHSHGALSQLAADLGKDSPDAPPPPTPLESALPDGGGPGVVLTWTKGPAAICYRLSGEPSHRLRPPKSHIRPRIFSCSGSWTCSLCLQLEAESRSTPALAVWGCTQPAAPSEPAGQRASDGEGPSVPSCSEAGGCPWRGPGGGHHTGHWGSPLCSQDPSGRSLVPLLLHSWPYPPPLRLHTSPPPSPTGVPRASAPRSGVVPPFPTPSLDRTSNLSAFPSPPPPAPPILPSARGVP